PSRYTLSLHDALPILVLLRVDAAVLEHVRVDHAAAENFQPIVARADLQRAAGAIAADIDFRARFGEREMVRAEAELHFVDFEIGDRKSTRLNSSHVKI